MSLKIDVLNVGKHVTMTKDNVKLTIDSNVTYRVTNAVIAFYVLGKIIYLV
jgi:regulator of protease activity HflC (stomatin/prohibitin superfamily)